MPQILFGPFHGGVRTEMGYLPVAMVELQTAHISRRGISVALRGSSPPVKAGGGMTQYTRDELVELLIVYLPPE